MSAGQCERFNRKGQRCRRYGLHVLHVYGALPRARADDWAELDAWRQAVQERAGGLCETPEEWREDACGLPFVHMGQHAHHVRLRSQGGKHTVNNGRFLCAASHAFWHGHPTLAVELGLIVQTKASAS